MSEYQEYKLPRESKVGKGENIQGEEQMEISKVSEKEEELEFTPGSVDSILKKLRTGEQITSKENLVLQEWWELEGKLYANDKFNEITGSIGERVVGEVDFSIDSFLRGQEQNPKTKQNIIEYVENLDIAILDEIRKTLVEEGVLNERQQEQLTDQMIKYAIGKFVEEVELPAKEEVKKIKQAGKDDKGVAETVKNILASPVFRTGLAASGGIILGTLAAEVREKKPGVAEASEQEEWKQKVEINGNEVIIKTGNKKEAEEILYMLVRDYLDNKFGDELTKAEKANYAGSVVASNSFYISEGSKEGEIVLNIYWPGKVEDVERILKIIEKAERQIFGKVEEEQKPKAQTVTTKEMQKQYKEMNDYVEGLKDNLVQLEAREHLIGRYYVDKENMRLIVFPEPDENTKRRLKHDKYAMLSVFDILVNMNIEELKKQETLGKGIDIGPPVVDNAAYNEGRGYAVYSLVEKEQ